MRFTWNKRRHVRSDFEGQLFGIDVYFEGQLFGIDAYQTVHPYRYANSTKPNNFEHLYQALMIIIQLNYLVTIDSRTWLRSKPAAVLRRFLVFGIIH